MTVLEVLENASLYLNLKEEFESIFNNDKSAEVTEETQNQFEKLIDCLNLVVSDIAGQYCKLMTTEKVQFVDNSFDILNLTKCANKIFFVKDENGFKQNFKIIDNKIVCENSGNFTVEYSFYPQKFTKDDELSIFSGKIGVKTFALGVACEYCFVSGFFDDAKIWEERFVNCLKNNLRKIGHSHMPKRRWFWWDMLRPQKV